MMMNALALGLVLTSLVTAGFFTPCPEKQNLKQDVIVKQGHRVIVVEYEKDDGNTKVSISPQDSHKIDETEAKDKLSEKMANLKEGAKEASSSVLPEMGMKLDNQEEDVEAHHGFSARELVCDAYGKCKHKLASAMGKTTEAVAEEAKEAVGKAKDTVSETAHKAYDKVHEAKESAKDSATEISTKAKEKAAGVKEAAKEQGNKAKRHVHEVRENVEREVSDKIEGTKEMVAEKAKHVRREGKKELREILRHAREVAVDVFDYVFSTERLSPWAGVLHLMGFAAAYGMCVWVTFASSYVLAGALPRNQFAMVQSKVYPVYFKAMAYSVGIAMLGHLMSPRKRLSGGGGMFQGFNLTAALAMILVNLLYLEPRATKVRDTFINCYFFYRILL